MRIVDLFSGAGGLTFGFYYEIKNNSFVRNKNNQFVFANELDKMAAKAFSMNFPDLKMISGDIKDLTKEKVSKLIGEDPVDIVIGGPPCQSYSTVGPRNFDERAVLYKEYSRILDIVRPKMFLFENVTGILSMREVFYKKDNNGNIIYKESNIEGKTSKKPRKRPVVDHYGEKIIDIITRLFKNSGYKITHQKLNAVDYGVPENRERVFIIGIREDLNINWSLDAPKDNTALSIKEAISDLPRVGEGQEKKKYDKEPRNDYQRLMRANSPELTQHYCGTYGKKIRMVIKNVRQGQGKNDFNKLVDDGIIDEEYRLTSGYANTYGRLEANKPCTTITDNLSTPSALRCIHYRQNRALTPREGARIQSFPDWFQFAGTKTNVTTQIGNAVPPLLAMKIAKRIEILLKG